MLPDQETINHKPYKNLNKKPSATDMVYCISKTQYAPRPFFCFKIPYLGEPYSRSTPPVPHCAHDKMNDAVPIDRTTAAACQWSHVL